MLAIAGTSVTAAGSTVLHPLSFAGRSVTSGAVTSATSAAVTGTAGIAAGVKRFLVDRKADDINEY